MCFLVHAGPARTVQTRKTSHLKLEHVLQSPGPVKKEKSIFLQPGVGGVLRISGAALLSAHAHTTKWWGWACACVLVSGASRRDV